MKYNILFLLLFSLSSLSAQDTVLNQKVEQLLELSGAKAQFETALDGMLTTYKQNPAMMEGVPDDFWKKFSEEAKSTAFDDLLGRMVTLYLDHYTEEELDHQIAYLQSPLTQQIVAKQPQLLQESMTVGSAWGQEIGEKIARQIMEAKEDKN
ncbi:DUF2059 domain-containing protein [Neolewinella persica]|uniref:DUF2059 domain-containing protein n=1 Tax=Neolewinella persica TaxID=70998 RepID=UPI0003615336|nr:DUF2059 domain-containing protein [Neolewinella persica]